MARTNFEKLRVYQLAESLADEIWNIVLRWNHFARNTVGVQIVEASDSIGSDIAEGAGRGTYRDNRCFVRIARCFVRIARGSLNETKHWLRRAYCRKLLTDADVDKIKPIMDELAPKLNAYLNSLTTAMKGQRSTNH
jgi:four helix bundle protein